MPSTLHREPTPTGIDLLDEQHLVLHRMILEVEAAFTRGERPGLLVESLTCFYQYAQIHFESEESLLSRYLPERLEVHARSHERLLATLRAKIVDYKRNGSRIPASVLDLLATFVSHHSDRTDARDFEVVRERLRLERSSLLTLDEG